MAFRAARISAGKTVKEVTDYMGVTDAAVYQWESGTFLPRPDKLVKLAKFYGCTVDELLSEDTAILHSEQSHMEDRNE